jgi:hypothetical protein
MSVKVSSPKQSRIPDQFNNDPVVRKYVEFQRDVLYQLWTRTGGGFDGVAAKKIITIIDTDTVLDDAAYGSIIVVTANTGTVQVTLPPVVESRLGESVIVCVIDATFATTVVPDAGTVLGAASHVISAAYTPTNYSPISTTAWINI